MYWLNYQQLLYFREIAHVGSISMASKKLNISSPALSMQLKILEDSIGHKLFERKSKRLFINEYGKFVLSYADRIFAIGGELISSINKASLSDTSQFKLGFNDALPKTLTTRVTKLLLKKFPRISLTVIEGNIPSLQKSLNQSDCDIIFTNRSPNIEKGDIKSIRFHQSDLYVYGVEKFRSQTKDFPQSLEGSPFILPNVPSEIRRKIDLWFIKHNVHYRQVIEAQDSSAKKSMAIEGIGMVVLPNYGVEEILKEKKLIKIGKLEGVQEDFYYSVKKGQSLNKEIIDFLDVRLQKGTF
jgi:LysR family transcriptional activator of nhaA